MQITKAERQKIVDALVEAVRPAERFAQNLHSLNPGLRDLLVAAQEQRYRNHVEWVENLKKALLVDSGWRDYAKTPAIFDDKLEKICTSLKAHMKDLYSISAHAPTRNYERDRKIRELHEDKGMTFGEIGKKLKISAKAAGMPGRS